MRLTFLAFLALLVVGLTVMPALADQTTTRPASTQPSDSSGPKAAMLNYDLRAGSGPEAFIPFFHTRGPEDERLVHAAARTDAMLGMLQMIVEKKWGSDSVNTVLHAFGSKTRDDMEAASVIGDAERALLTWSDGSEPVTMVRVDGEWKIDATFFRQSIKMPLDDYIQLLRNVSPVIRDIADAIADGRLTTPEMTAAEVRGRLTKMKR